MSNPSDVFECRWQPSRQLLAAYLIVQALALGSLALADIPSWGGSCSVFRCAWRMRSGVCQDMSCYPIPWLSVVCVIQQKGWQLWSARGGWQSVQLRPDSLALPLAIILRFRLPEERWVRGICIPRDALARDVHRRLRVRLKFSRRRWVAPE
ncbi:protein YgfX [Azotobacter vinelandii]